jgi:hypothetical protein
VADTRSCEQCGTVFAPRREHGRFCSARCRVAWNREKMTDASAEVDALQWSIAAMTDTTARLPRIRVWDRPRAFMVIGEAVWWVTIVDGTLVRYHPETYDAVLACQSPAERRMIEETLAGLRFVRNQMGHDVDPVEFIRPDGRRAGADGSISHWRWNSLAGPAIASQSPRGQAWEMSRYHAYQARLAGHPVAETFARATAFLKLAAARAVPGAELTGRVPRHGR